MIKGTGSQHIMSTEIVPSDNLWKNEDDFDGAYIDYSFATINRANRQIIFDLWQKHKQHVYNQDSGGRKLWEILLESVHMRCHNQQSIPTANSPFEMDAETTNLGWRMHYRKE